MKGRLRAYYAFICAIMCSLSSEAQLIADFQANTTTGCAPIVVQFADVSTGNPTGWSWNLGNGTISTQRNPSTTYILPGTYTVSLTVYDGLGGSHTTTRTNYINVTPSPQVSFYASDSQNICPPATLQFTNQTVSGAPGAVSYSWDFGDGNTSNQEHPSYTYTTPGNYMVTLVATNSNNCPGSRIRRIQVVNRPQAVFSASNNTGCTAPLTVAFTNTSANASSYTWLFGDGGTSSAISPTHTYTAPGTYTVTLIARNAGGCADTLIRSNLVTIGRPTASFNLGNTSICAGTNASFTNTSTGASSYQWSFGDNTTSTAVTPPAKAYNTAGTYTIRLIAIQGNCRDTFTRTLTVLPRPVADYTADSTAGCRIPHTVRFTNNSTGAASYSWTFGDGGTSNQTNPVHTYTATGNRTVTLVAIGSNGCSTTLTRSSYIQVAILTPAITAIPAGGGCVGDTMRFTGAVSPPPYPISSYSWDFGDGGTASGANTFHVYNTPGVYPVTLNILTVNGCIYTRTINVNMSAKPDAAFTASPLNVCVNEPVTFTNASTGGLTDFWQFGDGNGSSSPNPVHRYQDTGTYTVRLIAFSNYCSDTVTEVNLIRVTGPEALFTPVYSCTSRLAVTFTNNSRRAVTYAWDFGDGGTSTQQNPLHTYAAAGTYPVRLIAVDANGCRDTATNNVTVYAPPAVGFSANDTTICRGETVTFTRLSNPPGYTYAWSFGDGGVPASSALTVTRQYNIANTYQVRLIVSDGNNCRDTMLRPNYIHVGGPVPQFSVTPNPATGCSPLTVNFTDQSTAPGSTIASRVWHFGDGTILTGNNATPSNTYYSNTARTYNVRLVVTDANGCRDSIPRNNIITIIRPTANFNNPPQACRSQPVTFTNTSFGGAASYIWDFGDGNSSTLQHPVHTYAAAGTYSVRLIAVNSAGCRDTLLRNNTIRIEEVTAAFTMSDSVADCPPLIVQFNNTSSGASSYTYAWDFGNGITSSVANPSSVYTMPGVYTVLLVTTGNGCVDSTTRTITVNGPHAQGGFQYTPLSGCVPVTVSFSAVAVNTQTYSWDMNNGSTQTTTTNTYTYTYTEPGSYVPVLVLSNSANCNVAVVGTDTIHIDQVEGDFSYTASAFCVDNPVQFRDTVYQSGSQQITRNWDFGDGNGSTQQHPAHIYTAAGTYTVRLVLTNGNGCADTISHDVTIYDLPVITVTATPPAICPGETIQLLATGADTFSWSPATDLSCTACPDPVATPLSSVTYVVWGTDVHGCADSASVNIAPGARPVLAVSSDTTVCYGSELNLSASGAATYSWSPATGLSCGNCPAPVATATATTTYTVIGASADGCTDTATVTVTVNPLPVLTITPGQDLCVGSSLQLQAGGADNYNWSPATGLSCTTCPDPVATPATTTTYIVTGTDANNCFDTAQVRISVLNSPTVNVTDRDVCIGDSVTLQATGATAFQWSPSVGLSCVSCSNPVASPSLTTVYTVIGAIAGGCSDTTQVTVTVHDLPVVSAGQDQEVCTGLSAVLQASGAATYTWSPGVGLSCTSCDNPTATPSATTTYTVTGVDGNGCRDTAEVTVALLPLPAITASPDDDICIGDSISLTASGAVTYSWSPAVGLSCVTCSDPIASPLTTTTYTVIGTDTNGCIDSARVMVNVVSRPVIVVADRDVCLGDSVGLQASGAATYQWSPSDGLSCTNCPDPMVSPSVTTTYTVRGTLASGCSDTTQVTVTVHDLPVVSAGQDQEVCSGLSAVLQASGAATYTWSPGVGLSCTSCDNPTATPSATTTYTVTGVDGNGCRDTAEVTVALLPLPAITASPDDDICIGDSISLTASGAVTYSWSPAVGLSCVTCSDPIASPLTTTTYTVIGTDTNGCIDSARVMVNVVSRPVIVVADRDVCLGDSVGLQASGAATYQWSPSDGLSCTNCPDPMVSPSVTTTYTVRGTLASGCSDTTQVTVTVHDLPVVSAGQDEEICVGESAALQASGAATYTWSPGIGLSCANCVNPVATPTDTTMYVVSGTDAAGCVNYDTVTVHVKPLPSISAGNNRTVCSGDTAHLAATGGVSYTWDATTDLSCLSCPDPVATPQLPVTYRVTGTGANGCTDTASVTVSFYPQPVLSGGGNRDLCRGDTVRLQASGGINYSWSPATNISCVACADPDAWPDATTTYMLRGESTDGCVDSVAVTVVVHDIPVVSAGTDQEICLGENTVLNVSGAATYAWTPASGLSCTNCAAPSAAPSATTLYTVIGVSQAGCADTAEVTVTVHSLPQVTTDPDPLICRGDTARLQAFGANTYTWSPSAGLSCTGCADPVAAPSAPTTYTVTGMDTNGCVNTSQVRVVFHPDPVISAGEDQTICRGEFAQLQASGGVRYIWNPASGLSCTDCPDPVAAPVSDMQYYVTGTDGNGCAGSDTVSVFVVQPAVTSVGRDTRICAGQTTQLSASGGVRYLWSPPLNLSCTECADPVARPDTTTRYRVIIAHNHCFADTLYQTVEVLPIPTVSLGSDQYIFAGEQVRLFANSMYASSYVWSPPDGLSCTDCISPVATPERTITYRVEAYNELGCSATDDIRITLKCDGSMLFVPNTFTPNGDGQNDRFFPHANGIRMVDLFRVFNRWGEVVFERQHMPVNNPVHGWDGTFKGQVLSPDTYVYILQATCINGEQVTLKGDVSLVR